MTAQDKDLDLTAGRDSGRREREVGVDLADYDSMARRCPEALADLVRRCVSGGAVSAKYCFMIV